MFKRFASVFLALIMVLGIFPIGVLAETAVTDIRDRANLQLGEFGDFFKKEISGFGSNGIHGTHIRYIYNVSKDLFVEDVLKTLSGNTEKGFLGMIESPDPSVYTKVEKIDLDWEDKTSQFVDKDGNFDGSLGWFNYVDGNGNLCNVSKTFGITWTNADGTQKYTDNIMLSVVFPQIPSRTSDRTGLAMPEELRGYFETSSNYDGDYLEYRWNVQNSTEESIKTSLAALNGKVAVMMDAPNAKYHKIKKISWNGTDHTNDFPKDENGNIEFNGQIMVYNYLDGNGNLQNYTRNFEIVWTDSTGTADYVDKIKVALVFFEEGPNEPERQPSNNSGEELYPEEVTMEVHSALDGVTYTYDPQTGVVEFVIAENDQEDWKAAYVSEGVGSNGIGGDVIIQAPDWAVGYTGINGNGMDLETFKNIIESEDHEFDPIRNSDREYRNGVELAHITRNEKTGKATVSLKETDDEFTHFAWVDANGNISYQIVKITAVIAENTEKIFTFEDDFADIRTIASRDFNNRIEINGITSNLMTEEDSEGNLNYKDGVLTLTYTGNGTDYESVKDSFAKELGPDGWGEANLTVYSPAAGYKAYKMEFSSGENNPQGNATTLPVWALFYGEERIFSNDEYYLYWISEDGTDFIIEKIGVSFKFPFKNVWMEKYWDALSYGEENSRLKFTVGTSHSTAVEYTLEELEAKGAVLTFDEGFINISFEEDHDLYVITNIIAQVDAPEDAVYYKRNQSSAPNVLDYENADDQNEIVTASRKRTIEADGKPRMDLSGFRVVEVNGLKVYISDMSGTRVQVIDWYNENDEIIQRDYFYVVNEDFAVTKVTESVTENELKENGAVAAPTPLVQAGQASWKLTTSQHAQEKSYNAVNAYYFQLEGDENTPEGDKVIYLPYSFIEEGFTYEKALEKKLEPKIHHYTEDHEELVEGKPLDGELTEYGIRFVVSSFSPFVLEWEEQEETEEKPSVRPIRPVWGGGNKVTIIDGREEEKNPETGAPVFEISSAIAVLSTAAVICFRKKK